MNNDAAAKTIREEKENITKNLFNDKMMVK